MLTAVRLMAVAYDDLCRATLKLAPLMAGKAFVAPGNGIASPTTGILGETPCRHRFRESQPPVELAAQTTPGRSKRRRLQRCKSMALGEWDTAIDFATRRGDLTARYRGSRATARSQL